MRDRDDSDRDLSAERESTMLRAALTADVAGRPSGHLLAADGPDAEGPRARVLYADDDPATRELVANTLRASGYEVETSPDGQDAVDRVSRGGFDVVLLDAVMPRMSGFDACRVIRGLSSREREDFVIEATYLMRDRLLMNQVYERLGWDVATWVQWANTTPFMQGFRQMLFSKIVPNLKRLGLLTPRVRAEYAKIGLLHFEDLADSTVDPEPMPPAELIALLGKLREASLPAS